MENQKRKLSLPGISFYPDNLSEDETIKRFCAAASKPADNTPKTVKLTERLKAVANGILQHIRLPVDRPETLTAIGMPRTKGVLLYGSPGTGKTSIAKAVEIECNRTADKISYFPVEISVLMNGNVSANVKNLFHSARMFAPTVIFLDEVDALFHERGPTSPAVLTLLTEIEGISTSEKDIVFVLAATNRKDAVESALLRGGRIEESIELTRPDANERLELLKSFTITWDVTKISWNWIVTATDEFTPADLMLLCKKASMIALKRTNDSLNGPPSGWAAAFDNKVVSCQSDFDRALTLVQPTPQS